MSRDNLRDRNNYLRKNKSINYIVTYFFDSWCRTIQNEGLQRCRPFVFLPCVTTDVTRPTSAFADRDDLLQQEGLVIWKTWDWKFIATTVILLAALVASQIDLSSRALIVRLLAT